MITTGSSSALGAAEAVRAMREGGLRAEDYARALLDRAERSRHLNAFLWLDADAVLESARAADRLRASGARLGLLHGLPLPVKDSVNTRNVPTTNGTRSLRHFRPREDAAILTRLAAEGAFVFGKTNIQELSRGWTSNNGAFGAVRNAWNPARVPGGSSGGSATAVAAGIAPMAIAEDTWGSIRVPASWCGVAGLRPTVGRYPNDGTMPLSARFDQVGPVARSVEDLVLFDMAATGDARPLEPVTLAGARFGVPEEFMAGIAPEVARVVEEAFARLRDAGAVLVPLSLPPEAANCAEVAATIIAAENIPAISAFLARHDTGVTFAELISQASENIRSRYVSSPPSAEEHQEALHRRERLIAALSAFYARHRIEALVFPPLLSVAPPLGDNPQIEVGGILRPISEVVGRNTALGNTAGLASLVLPAGLAGDGLPVGLEFDALPGGDRRLLALGAALETALGFKAACASPA